MRLETSPYLEQKESWPFEGRSIEYLTAETERGRLAIQEVMRHSYSDDVDHVPAQWTRVRVVDGVPLSFIQIDPNKRMEFAGGDVRYAFIMNVATREDRRREGHFRGIMEHAFASLRVAGLPIVVTHGRYPLYRPFGFEVFTHHSGIFATPALIERKLGTQVPAGGRAMLDIMEHKGLHKDLLLVTDVKVETLEQCRSALLAAAALARERGKGRILFEHPAAPSYGSHYPIYASPETPLMALARACGAEVRLQGADPEGGSIPDADWIKVLDAGALVREALRGRTGFRPALPRGTVCFDTDAGAVTIERLGDSVAVSDRVALRAAVVKWPSSALAQLVTGYRSAELLAIFHGTVLATEALALLAALFPPCWRFSRNESWTFAS